MPYIDPHIHMVSRTTDDYAAMAAAGCVAVTEPAFWAGFDRGSPEGFRDYFRQLTVVEPKRAARFGIDHYCWLCINPKEAEDPGFGREVIQLIPEFLDDPELSKNVLGIGEIGLNRNTKNELAILEEQIALACDPKYSRDGKTDQHQLILVHTPHLEDKRKGTKLILDALKRNGKVNPDRVLIDHVEEHTIELVLDAGYWAGMTLYPDTKCTPQRAADLIETYGPERLWLNSAGDWGHSDPLAVPKAQQELRGRDHPAQLVEQLTLSNPQIFLSQNEHFRVT